MALKLKYQYKHEDILRDARPWSVRMHAAIMDPSNAAIFMGGCAVGVFLDGFAQALADLLFFICLFYFWRLMKKKAELPFKLPKSARIKDPNQKRPDGSLGMADGILYLGNTTDTGEEIWFTNSDARTHCLYLGTTGSGKTFGLKSYACNAFCWSSGFIYIDGKADTDLWSTLSAMARRFGRDDDLLIMNYMTGNASGRVASNTLNPFSSGSASYLTNMLVSLMPDSEGDNAMWKDRAVALVSALMPCLVWKRENQNIPLSIGVIRQYLTFKAVIRLSRDSVVPEHMRTALKGYLNELPGFVDNVFDDNGDEKPMSPDAGAVDTSVPRQQHGYLSMQFTRSMQSLGDDYGFIFDTQAADVDMLDVVLNRRILVVLIPALEKSADETANLGKIIASTLKGMMGATLGNSVEGSSETAIENKPTNSATPFIAIFDEVGYYTSQGMAVMAAQARSLGFSLVFAGQDLPALEKRVKEEARSITANCNIKLFGKLEDPTQTKEFFEKTVGQAMVTEVSGFQRTPGFSSGNYQDGQNASVQVRARAGYDGLKGFNEGRAICAFGKTVSEIQVYNSDIGHARAMRVHRFLPIPPPAEDALEHLRTIDSVLKRLRNPQWDAAALQSAPDRDIEALAKGFAEGKKAGVPFVECGLHGVATVADAHGNLNEKDIRADAASKETTAAATAQTASPAQKAAAAEVAEKVPGGPLSWMEVIGGAVDAAAPAAPAAPVAQATPAPAAAPAIVAEEDQPTGIAGFAPEPPHALSWDAVLGLTPSSAPPEEKAVAQTAAAGAALSAPLSWMDVIGGDAASMSAQPPEIAAAPVPAAPAPLQPAPLPAGDTEEKPSALSWADVIGAMGRDDDKKS